MPSLWINSLGSPTQPATLRDAFKGVPLVFLLVLIVTRVTQKTQRKQTNNQQRFLLVSLLVVFLLVLDIFDTDGSAKPWLTLEEEQKSNL